MKLKSYKLLFRIFSFLSDKTNGAPLFVRYKLLLGTLILGLVSSVSAGKSKKEATYYVPPAEQGMEETTCYKPVPPASNDTVRGRVVDESGVPVYGYTVKIKGTVFGTITGENGQFSLEAGKGDTLVFNYIGMETREVPVHEITDENTTIVVKEDVAILCYEVVVVPYPAEKRTKFTYYEVDYPPVSPVGDLDDFNVWMEENIQYTPEMAKDEIEGEVAVSFVVNKKGKITNKKIIVKLSPQADGQVLKLLSSLGKWQPGKHQGKPVSTSVTMSVYFVLP